MHERYNIAFTRQVLTSKSAHCIDHCRHRHVTSLHVTTHGAEVAVDVSLTCSRQPALSPWQPELANDCSKVQAAQREVTSLSFPLQSQLLSCSRSWGGWWWWGAVRLWGRGAGGLSVRVSRHAAQCKGGKAVLSCLSEGGCAHGSMATHSHTDTFTHTHFHSHKHTHR